MCARMCVCVRARVCDSVDGYPQERMQAWQPTRLWRQKVCLLCACLPIPSLKYTANPPLEAKGAFAVGLSPYPFLKVHSNLW